MAPKLCCLTKYKSQQHGNFEVSPENEHRDPTKFSSVPNSHSEEKSCTKFDKILLFGSGLN